VNFGLILSSLIYRDGAFHLEEAIGETKKMIDRIGLLDYLRLGDSKGDRIRRKTEVEWLKAIFGGGKALKWLGFTV
jgi:hypothetical protein